MGLRLYSRQSLSSPILSNSYTRTYNLKFKQDNKITHRSRKGKVPPKTRDGLQRIPKARRSHWQQCLSKMENMFNTLMKVLNKAKSQAGLLGIADQHWRPNGFLSSDMIIDQTRASQCEIVTTLMGQIYGDIESVRITRQANAKLQGRLSSMLSSEDQIVHQVLGKPISCLCFIRRGLIMYCRVYRLVVSTREQRHVRQKNICNHQHAV